MLMANYAWWALEWPVWLNKRVNNLQSIIKSTAFFSPILSERTPLKAFHIVMSLVVGGGICVFGQQSCQTPVLIHKCVGAGTGAGSAITLRINSELNGKYVTEVTWLNMKGLLLLDCGLMHQSKRNWPLERVHIIRRSASLNDALSAFLETGDYM